MGLPNRRTQLKHETAAVMYSGGIDSSVIIADLLAEGFEVFPIAFDDGSDNYRLRRKVAIETTLQKMGILNRLTVARIPDPEPLRISRDTFGFVPGYKMTMIVVAMSYCQVLDVNKLYMGYNLDNQDGGFLDEGSKFMEEVSDLYYRTYSLETNNEFPFRKRISVLNPYFDKSKAEMIKLGVKHGVDFTTMISCRQVQYGAGVVHCGKCEVCRRRHVAFKEAGMDSTEHTIWHSVPDGE